MRVVRFVSVLLHIAAVYICAVHFSPILVGRWYAWFGPPGSTSLSAQDWYLQHLEIMTIIPALIAGFLIAQWFPYGSTWTWIAPSAVLLFELLSYSAPHSALIAASTNRFSYFFEIQKHMPSVQSYFYEDPVRIYRQMVVTAPFYAGIFYAVGAKFAKTWSPRYGS